MEFSVLGPVAVHDRVAGTDVAVSGAKRRALLTLLLLNANRVVPAERLIDDLWEGDPPESPTATLQSHISHLRRLLGAECLQTRGGGYVLVVDDSQLDARAFDAEVAEGRTALAGGDAAGAASVLTRALRRWRGPAYDDAAGAAWAVAEVARLEEARLLAVESLFDARLALGDHGGVVGDAEAAVSEHPLRERLWAQLMLALYRDGRQADALRAYQRVRAHLTDELGIEPGPELRALEQAILSHDPSLAVPARTAAPKAESAAPSLPSGVVTFLLTDVVGSSQLWETAAAAMPDALRIHNDAITDAVTAHDGIVLKPRGEGDSTFSVFRRATDGAAAALDAQAALAAAEWPAMCEIRVRMALHTGEAFERDGDYFGPALNRAARLRSLAGGGQILVSQAVAELVRDHLPDATAMQSLGHRDLHGLSRGENVFELGPAVATMESEAPSQLALPPLARPPIPGALASTGPFVGRSHELQRLAQEWDDAVGGAPRAAVIGGEPGVGKTRLAAERARLVHQDGGLVLYGRCDEDLGAPYQPFAEAFRTLLPCLGGPRLTAVRGIEELSRLVPELDDVLPDLRPPTRADPDTERYVLFDTVARLLVSVSSEVPALLVLDDLHWATKPTLLMLRHVLRNGEHARLHIVATYRTTDLDPAHPLAATLTDLHRDGTATRVLLGGLGEDEVNAYLDAAGYEDDHLANTLAEVTSGNPFFLREVLLHLDETGGRWDPSTLPQGVREAVGRRLARLSPDANEALLAGAVTGGRFRLDLIERVAGRDLVEAVTEARDAELVVEETGGWFRFNHDIVRRSLLAGVASVKRVRLHQRIAEELEVSAAGDDGMLADLAHHYFESAWAGNAGKAVEYCRRAGDQAMARLAYEGAADLYDRALQAMEVEDAPGRDDDRAELLLARCEALLAAGDVASATDAVARLEEAAGSSARLAAWATCFAGQLAVLIHPDQLDTIEGAVAAAAEQLAELDDAAGEAKAHTVRASCLARLGRHADCESALDRALTAARRGGEHRRVNAVLAGAPLAALWGPSPVPRAGGRCLDVIRLLRITTGSAAVEATSIRCQAVLEAFRGRSHAAHRMLDAARRSLTELGLRHALFEVDQFAGVVELVDGDAAAAAASLRRAYAGFRRMGVDADAAQAAALLAQASIELGDAEEADALCAESERLAGHDLKASIAWRAVRAQLLSNQGDQAHARELANAAVAIAERTDALVDHGDACLALARVLDAAGDRAGARRAAEQAAALYERKGAAALVERARQLLDLPAAPAPVSRQRREPSERVGAVLENLATRAEEKWTDRFLAGDLHGLGALIAEEFVLDDRRRGIQYQYDRDVHLETVRLGVESFGSAVEDEVIATRGNLLALMLRRWASTGDRASESEIVLLIVTEVDDEGQFVAGVVFDPDDLDGAFAELDNRYLNGEGRAHAQTLELLIDEVAAFNARDWERYRALMADDFVLTDHRLASLGTITGRDDVIPAFRAMVDLATTRTYARAFHAVDEGVVVASYAALGVSASGLSTDTSLVAVCCSTNDRLTRFDFFAADQLNAAMERFEQLRPRVRENLAAATQQRFYELHVALDWDGVAAMMTDDFVSDDRRTGVRAVIPKLQYVESCRAISSPGWIFDLDVVATRGEHLAVLKVCWRSPDYHPGAPQLEFVNVCEVAADGRLARMVAFDPDDLDAAYAELEARFESLQRRGRLNNLATRTLSRWVERFAVRDWDGVRALVTEDILNEDRRTGVRNIERGRDAHVESSRAGERGQFEIEVVAIRGDRLAIHRLFWVESPDAGANEVEVLRVDAVTPDGRLSHHVGFDPHDVDAALDELDALYLADEGSQFAETVGLALQQWKSYNTHDWDAFGAQFSEDFRLVDHRPAGWGTTDRWGFIELLRTMAELAPDIHGWTRAVFPTLHGAVLDVHLEGTDQNGNRFVLDTLTLARARAGLTYHLEMFPIDDLDVALAHLDEPRSPQPLANAASAARVRSNDLLLSGDYDAAADAYAEDAVTEERRSGVRQTLRGREELGRALRAVGALGVVGFQTEVVATRGDRLALLHMRAAGPDHGTGAFEAHILDVCEIDDAGRLVRSVVFDEDALDAAFAELDAMYLDGEGAPYAATLRPLFALAPAYNARAWDRYGPLFADDVVIVDHRPASLGTLRGQEAIRALQARVELAPSMRSHVIAVEAVDHGTVFAVSGIRGYWDRLDSGVDVMTSNVYTVAEGRVQRLEMLWTDDRDAAFARFDELRRSGTAFVPENAAIRASRSWDAQMVAGEWAECEALLADDFMFHDDRFGVRETRMGREQGIALMKGASATGVANLEAQVVATRGDRLALRSIRARGSGPGAFETEMLTLVEVDVDGRIRFFKTYDVDALNVAFDELGARYLAGEGAPYAATLQPLFESWAAYNERDWERFRASMADHYVLHDHRPASLGLIADADETARALRALVELIPGLRVFALAVDALDHGRAVFRMGTVGGTEEGAPIDLSTYVTCGIADGHVTGIDMFPLDQHEAAFIRFEELRGQAADLDTLATRALRLRNATYLAGDWSGLETLFAADAVNDDRRRGLLFTHEGRAAIVENWRQTRAVGTTRLVSHVCATRGDRLVLYRTSGGGSGPDAYEVETLAVMEVDEAGRIARESAYDGDALDTAFDELEARYLDGEAAPFARTWRSIVRTIDAINRHEELPLPDTYQGVDHRPFSLPTANPRQWTPVELADAVTTRITAVPRLDVHGAVVRMGMEATTQDGGAVAWSTIAVITVGDHGRTELFAEDDIDAALARFDELTRK
jgi:DNA-binding SARP family transcriptional activator